ncbi:Pre-mRNA-splicing factor of RES complex-domain-containing protein [Xylariomycetidae sp. FL0641]|nr:Pre-mRNA-splicing factor of RES complex-domain-containing protein [Xylariomycetidae sp. FL0641]
MPSDLSSYLATHYLTADPKPSKKRKRKNDGASSGLIIADDDATGWTRAAAATGSDDADEPAATVAGTSAEFRKAKKSGWKTLGGGGGGSSAVPSSSSGAPPPTTTTTTTNTDDAAAAAAVLASATADKDAAGGGDDDDAAPVLMSDGTYAGLQSGAAVSAQLAARRRAERAEFERSSGGGKAPQEAETIYRDATGRRVDVSLKRAELRREAEAAARKKEDAAAALRGEVQVEAARARRSRLEDARTMAVARHADDAEINAEMKGQTRWGDTMAGLIGSGGGGGGGGGTAAGDGKKKVKGRPEYKGAAPPNRYGIRPGYRWDGVDRGNGFEAERFKALNRRERNKGLEYSWQMDE